MLYHVTLGTHKATYAPITIKRVLESFVFCVSTYSAFCFVDSGSSVVNSFPDGQVRYTNRYQGETNDDRRTNHEIHEFVDSK